MEEDPSTGRGRSKRKRRRKIEPRGKWDVLGERDAL
jgi:hypothetical protein